MTEYRDIVIAGGGMVGVSLALQLAASLPAETSILLVEGFPFPEPVAGGVPDYHPSFDARCTALSYSSRLIYERMGVWQGLQQWLCEIETIHVSSRGHFGSTLMNAADYGWPALGYVVENAWLGNALVQSLHGQGRVELCSPARVARAEAAGRGTRLWIESGEQNRCLETGLLVVADGASSGLRAQLGLAVEEKPYGQHALVTNVSFDKPHGGCAFERFTERGPLALLPLLPTAEGEYRSGLVWSLPPDEAQYLGTCSPQAFLRQLQQRFGYRLGRMRQVGERHDYPLALVRCAEQVRQGIVIMGNAAHALHPVAGQGYNLALRDVVELANAVARGVSEQRPAGDLAVLQGYQRRQRADQQRTIGFSDELPGLFMHRDPMLGLARDLALSGLDVAGPLKREFVRYAAGVAAMGE